MRIFDVHLGAHENFERSALIQPLAALTYERALALRPGNPAHVNGLTAITIIIRIAR
jgi:hypothetical protein